MNIRKILLTSLVAVGGIFSMSMFAHASRDIVTFQSKGSADVALGVSSIGVVYNTYGLFNEHETLIAPAAVSTTAILDVTVSTGSLVSGSSTTVAVTQPTYPSALTVQISFDQGTSTSIVNSTVSISGVDSFGSSRTITVSASTTQANTGIAFVRVSSVTIGNVNYSTNSDSAANLNAHITIGNSGKIGLANQISNAIDVYLVTEDTTNTTDSVTIDVGNSTIDVVTDPDGSTNYQFWYRGRRSPPHRVHPDQ